MTYTRVNWQDSPSTATPIDAANLNVMDAGIAALSNGSPGSEIGYVEITSSVTVTSTTEASPTTVITLGSLAFDGSPVILEFFSEIITMPTSAIGANLAICLFEGSTQLGRIWQASAESSATQDSRSAYAKYRFAPAAGNHTYTITAFVTSTTGTPMVGAGPGGTAASIPAFARITKA